MPLDFEKYNQEVIGWVEKTESSILSTAKIFGIAHRSKSSSQSSSLSKIKGKTRMKDGLINRVSYSFPRSLIWPHWGAGKGMGGNVGSTWLDKYGKRKKTNPESLGKMNTGKRIAKPFFDKVLDGEKGVDQLATIVAINIGDAITNNIFINKKLNGKRSGK